MDALLSALILQVVSGIAALLFARSPRVATVLGAGGAAAACLLGLAPAFQILLRGTSESLRLPWDAAHGSFSVGVDPLSAFFLLPVFGLCGLAAVYGGAYLFAYRRHKSLGCPWFFFNAFVAGMTMVVLARTALLFLVAWEIMSLAAFGLVTFEHEQAEVRRAGWVYLIATHLGVAFLFLAFVLLGRSAGSLDFEALGNPPLLPAATAAIVFVLALIGFGAKAGLVPFHIWLPEAHPAAPSHVSALMSGVMIKMGLYGLLRILTFLGPPAPWWGATLAALGLLTALVGIALALSQRDVKRVLAYSSIENIGLISLALGVGLWGWANGLPVVAVLGMAAALLHVWNHALLKTLMFFAAGSVQHATGTRDMEKHGGLMKQMPGTATGMLAGAVALAALPPFNGFVSKWLLYSSLIACGFATNDSRGLAALLAVGLVALVGGLAALTFVRLTGIVLLGSPRSAAARHAHESSPWMVAPMLVLVVLCLTVAVAPQMVANLLLPALDQVLGGQASRDLLELESSQTPLYVIGNFNAWTLVVVGAATVVFLRWSRRFTPEMDPTWGCAYVAPTVRMQYTGRSFAEMIAEHLLPRWLRPRTSKHAPEGLFPSKADFGADCPDPIREGIYEPFFRRWANRFSRLRILQQGRVHIYLLYIALVVVVALSWVSARRWWSAL
jgi:hydrogenase-4 component B